MPVSGTMSGYNGGGYDYFSHIVPIKMECRVKFDGSIYEPNKPYVDPYVKPKLASAVAKGEINFQDIIDMSGPKGRFGLRDRGVYRRCGAATSSVVKVPLFEMTKTAIVGIMGYITETLSGTRRTLSVGFDDPTRGIDIDTSLFLLNDFPAWVCTEEEIVNQLYPPLPFYPNQTVVGRGVKFFNPETQLSKGTIVNLYIKNDLSDPNPDLVFDPNNTTGSAAITEGDITFECHFAGYSTEQYDGYKPGKEYKGEDNIYKFDFGPARPLY